MVKPTRTTLLLISAAIVLLPEASAAAPMAVPPPDAGDTYAGIGGGGFTCNEHAICTATFNGSAQLAGWSRAKLHVGLNLYDNGRRVGSNSNTCAASTSCYTGTSATITFVRGANPQVCATATGQAAYSTGTAIGDDQACMYIGGGGAAAGRPQG